MMYTSSATTEAYVA